MADISTQAPATASITAPVRAFFSKLGAWFERITEANSKSREVQFLQSLSDQELAARGLKREDIVRHVFAGSLYL